jgi:SEC-C motif-containing protein
MTKSPFYPTAIQLLLIVIITILAARCEGFAAKKKPVRKTASTTKGFGAAPLTFDQVIQGFRTRLPENAESLNCPCGTGKLYKDCCKPFHEGAACKSPIDVLRSRYSAFSYRIIPHIIRTTHPTCRDYQENKLAWAQSLNRDGMFDSLEFLALEHGVEEVDADTGTGTIEFKVRMKAKKRDDDPLSDQETFATERSIFLRDASGAWLYSTGDARLADAILN